VYTYSAHGNEDARDTYKGAWANNTKQGIGKQIY